MEAVVDRRTLLVRQEEEDVLRTPRQKTKCKKACYAWPVELFRGRFYYGGPQLIGPMVYMKPTRYRYIFHHFQYQYLILLTVVPRNITKYFVKRIWDSTILGGSYGWALADSVSSNQSVVEINQSCWIPAVFCFSFLLQYLLPKRTQWVSVLLHGVFFGRMQDKTIGEYPGQVNQWITTASIYLSCDRAQSYKNGI